MPILDEYNERERALVSELENLRVLAEAFKTPSWKLLESTTQQMEQKFIAQFLEAKEASQMFHLQGRLLGVRSVRDFATIITSEAEQMQVELADIRAKKKELINNG